MLNFIHSTQNSKIAKILILLGLMILGFSVTAIISILISSSPNVNGELIFTTTELKVLQIIQAIFLFIIPSLVLINIYHRKPFTYLSLNHLPSRTILFLTLISMIAIIPIMDVLIEWNLKIQLPPSFHGIEIWMKMKETEATALTQKILSAHNVFGWIINFFIVGITAAFSEELFFRGTLQRLFSSKKNQILAIWVVAFIFSAIHLQFYGFFPRFLLGAYFGYLFVWTNNLWIPIFAHLINNSIALLQFGLIGQITDNATLIENQNLRYPLAGISLIVFYLIVKRIKDNKSN